MATVAGVLLGSSVMLAHCARPSSADTSRDCASCCTGADDKAGVVDPTLLAFLSKARAAHHTADLSEEDGDIEAAIAALQPIVSAARPPAPEAVEVVADTRARLAELESDLGRFDVAMANVNAGLELAVAPTHFRGHLFEVKGVVLERRYRSLDATGDLAAAAVAKTQALEAFRAAIEVQDQVIDEALSHGKR